MLEHFCWTFMVSAFFMESFQVSSRDRENERSQGLLVLPPPCCHQWHPWVQQFWPPRALLGGVTAEEKINPKHEKVFIPIETPGN